MSEKFLMAEEMNFDKILVLSLDMAVSWSDLVIFPSFTSFL